ncbi:hypothetical protein [Parvibium lacunae]|jgi:hypothetical protein|uniref:Uncharacterized protein n=1 Tax=Parvibium lacunae TaxID=1888893 RepID=A0A368L6M8_9BURK|nr:hypothetical protein [Parvibium lacunae]RCS59315.1 hypothetical protein DU000_00805 [Parvibium lacunae]
MSPSHFLVLNSTLTLAVSLFAGIPYGKAINQQASAAKIHGWRVAHSSLALGAAMGYAIAAVLATVFADIAYLTLNLLIAWAVTLCNYAFCFSLTLGAAHEERGLSKRGSPIGKLVYAGNMLGVVTSLTFMGLLLYASLIGPL